MGKTDHSANFKVIVGQPEEGDGFHYRPERQGRGFIAAEVPPHVDVELTNVCDLACDFCETLIMKRKHGMMSLETFRKVVDQCNDIGVRSIKLNLWGESLLNKQLCDMVDYAKKNTSLVLQFNTNANRLTPEISQRLVAAGLDRMTISVDGITKETYEKLRIKGDYAQVFANIHRLLDIRRESGTSLPHITLQIIRMTENAHELERFVSYWEQHADQVSVTNIVVRAKEDTIRFSLRNNSKIQRKACEQPWQRMSVLWDGSVTVCCSDFDGALKIGDIQQNTLLELWKGEALAKLRERHANLDFEGIVCNTCTDSMDFNGD